MWFNAKMSIFRSGFSYSVSRIFFKNSNGFLKCAVYGAFRPRGMCVGVSDARPRKVGKDKTNVVGKSEPRTKRLTPSKSVVSYILSRNGSFDIGAIPSKYLRKVKQLSEGQYLIDDGSAKILAESILSNEFVENDIPLFEVNPGLGLLTKYLLENGVPKINVFQSTFWSSFLKMSDEYPERIRMYEYEFFAFWRYLLLEISERTDKATIFLKSIEPKKWNDVPVMKIILTVPNKMFLNQLIASTIFQNGLMFYGRVEMFVLVSPVHFMQLTSGKEAGYMLYRPNTVFFQLLFEYKMLGKFPRKHFIPWEQTKKGFLGKKITDIEEEEFYLLKITPRKDIFDRVGGSENLKALWHFVIQCLSRRKNRVIPTLENWIPGCGPRLIVKGYTIFTQFGELSPAEIESVFLDFINWPEYPTSSFLPSMHATLLKKYVDLNKEGADDHTLDSVEEDSHLHDNV